MKRIALVNQRYGLEVNGGSEYYTRLIAERLASEFEVDVITTKALEYTIGHRSKPMPSVPSSQPGSSPLWFALWAMLCCLQSYISCSFGASSVKEKPITTAKIHKITRKAKEFSRKKRRLSFFSIAIGNIRRTLADFNRNRFGL